MRPELLQLAADLASRRQPFVLAMVVRRQPYSSAHQGDMAVITADGAYHGWLGGNCTQPVVKREAARALIDGRPRLLSLSPEPAADERPGVTVLPMVCQSGGTVDVYLEPFLPPPRLVLFGLSPVVRALAQLGKGLGYSVDVVDPAAGAREVPGADRVFVDWTSPELSRDGGETARTFAVVATMGEHDDEAVTTALGLRPTYLGVVASRTRFGQLREALLGRGVSAEPLDRIRNPAGLDIGARLPEEVALSILAEIVQRSREQAAEPVAPPVPEASEALDPVCGMTVVVATARHRAEHAGQNFFFCNPRCREKFLAAPEQYLTQSVAAR
ncbi:MAG TPA: XdhC family protein [Myxococcaceae bacterium]|nr:XdhC family protein [Myxococcaceae bacterium]